MVSPSKLFECDGFGFLLLLCLQAVRVGRGETAGQHALYVAYELATFNDFVARHDRHLVEMGETSIINIFDILTIALYFVEVMPF